MKKIIMVLIIVLMISGCSEDQIEITYSGLEIESYHSSIGSMKIEGNNDRNQRYEYTIEIVNSDSSDIKLISVEPLLSDDFKSYVVGDDLVVNVNKIITSGKVIEVTGMIIFNAENLTKEEILDKTPFVNDIKIIEEKVIKVTM